MLRVQAVFFASYRAPPNRMMKDAMIASNECLAIMHEPCQCGAFKLGFRHHTCMLNICDLGAEEVDYLVG